MSRPLTSRELFFSAALTVAVILAIGYGAREGPRRGGSEAPAATSSAAPEAEQPETTDSGEPLAPAAPPVTLAAPDLTAWQAAVARVEEKRGSPGRIETPPQLQHYEDNRRFLAMQMAASQEANLELPHDEAALAEMIQRGEVVELAPLGDDYILYDVGTDAHEDPLTHFDVDSGKDVPLVGSQEEYEREHARLAAEANGRGNAAARARERLELMTSLYGDPTRREQLFREDAAVTSLARDFGGVSYDLANPADRARFQVRLLSFLRPAARDVMLELARAYHRQFGRLLPVTSLIRTQRYQQRLARVNPNASHVEIPPHATGEAFDVSYKFMAPDEQNFVMREVARMKDEGRVEALRERRGHVHVYAFAGGRPPREELIAQFLDDVEAARASIRRAAPAPPKALRAARPARGGSRALRR
jgi:hypothetical protein